jgi:response regulator RpfG family c-di-GMP phosphodiesterase
LKRSKLIILSTDLESVRTLNAGLSRNAEVVWSRDGKGAVAVAAESIDFTAAIVDIAAAPTDAIEILEQIKHARPLIQRILLTDYCDLGMIVRGLHTSAVQNIVYKPIHLPELFATLGMQNVPVPHHVATAPVARRVAS